MVAEGVVSDPLSPSAAKATTQRRAMATNPIPQGMAQDSVGAPKRRPEEATCGDSPPAKTRVVFDAHTAKDVAGLSNHMQEFVIKLNAEWAKMAERIDGLEEHQKQVETNVLPQVHAATVQRGEVANTLARLGLASDEMKAKEQEISKSLEELRAACKVFGDDRTVSESQSQENLKTLYAKIEEAKFEGSQQFQKGLVKLE